MIASTRRTGRRARSLLLAGAFAALSLRPAHADVTVLIGEPFGSFGTMMPVGHTAVYLDRVCAQGPLKLRMCRPGEPAGVALARYHRVGDLDWMASPIMQFLYATDHGDEVLPYATPAAVWELRQSYRRRYLPGLVPDGHEYDKATDEWWESAGVAYNRKLWAYTLRTTPAQDEAFVQNLNDRPNHHLYHLSGTNCANFAAEMVNLFYPGSVVHDKVADFGLMTPKQVARSVEAYGNAHPELRGPVLEIPQLPGSLRRSRPVRGGAESGLKTKRYLFTLAVIQPEVPIGLWILYLKHGRWPIGRGAASVTPNTFERTATDLVAGASPPSAQADHIRAARASQGAPSAATLRR